MNFIWKFHAFAKPKCNAIVQMTQSKWLGDINGDYIIINENITLNRCIYLKYYFVLFAGEYEVTGWGEWCNRAFDGRPWEFRKESDRKCNHCSGLCDAIINIWLCGVLNAMYQAMFGQVKYKQQKKDKKTHNLESESQMLFSFDCYRKGFNYSEFIVFPIDSLSLP